MPDRFWEFVHMIIEFVHMIILIVLVLVVLYYGSVIVALLKQAH